MMSMQKGQSHATSWSLLVEFPLDRDQDAEQLVYEHLQKAMEGFNLSPGNLHQIQAVILEAIQNILGIDMALKTKVVLTVRILVRSLHSEDGKVHLDHTGLAGKQKEYLGWGFFLVDWAVAQPSVRASQVNRVIELYLYPE
jgi:hypothetical protein